MATRRIKDRWIVDFWWRHPDGRRQRVREASPVNTRRGAEEHERQLRQALLEGRRDGTPVVVPTVKVFAESWLEDARANRQKPSTIKAKEVILEHHLLPVVGKRKLDEVSADDVRAIKVRMVDLAPKTVNNALVVLSGMLKTAAEWKLLRVAPVKIVGVKAPPPQMRHLDDNELVRLLEGAAAVDGQTLAVVLLGAEAGLRSGEIQGLEWTDIDFRAGILTIERTIWRGQPCAPKGGRSRKVPMTARLAAALKALRHLQGPRVFYRQGKRRTGLPFTQAAVVARVKAAQRRGGLKTTGEVHVLRHTFCSRLAMAGAPAKAIQELAGHVSLATTQRYMHLSPAWREGAIRLLERDAGWAAVGQMEGEPSKRST